VSAAWPTLIVPSVHSRAALLDRALKHLEAQRFPGEIVISDHSPRDRLDALREVVARHGALRVLVLEHDPAWHFLERLTDCADACDSDYVAVHADDDFMFVEAMAECTGFLDTHPDYAAAKGRMLFFKPPSNALSKHEGFSRAEPDPAKRLIRHLANFNATLYAVHRRTQFIEAYRTALSHTTNVVFWQYLASCITLLQGKLQVLERAYYYRLDNEGGWRSALVRERSREHWPMLILAPELPRLLGEFTQGIGTALSRAGVPIDAELERMLEEAYVWLIRRGLCGMLETESAAADSAFIRRAAAPGTEAHRLLAACVELVNSGNSGSGS
jgi:glycosyltransferase domain-containing protein